MASPARPIDDHLAPRPRIADHQASPQLPTLPDGILGDIFLRLPTPTDLARASTACPSFRRIITDRSFLRRFRALRPPPLLGLVTEGFHAAEAPHASSPLARALAREADFSYSFVPTGRWLAPWRPLDVRQGRVLLECVRKVPLVDTLEGDVFVRDLELAVCDPLSRRYVLLPPIPDDLTAQHEDLMDFRSFLAPMGDNEEETSFRVICTASNDTTLLAIVFTSITGQWHIAASPSWSSLGTSPPYYCLGFEYFYFARGCFYWGQPWDDKLLVLDAFNMEFSINNLPDDDLIRDSSKARLVVGEDGTPLILFLSDHNEDDSGDLLHISKLNDSGPSVQWQLENIIPLPRQHKYSTVGVAEGFLFLHGIPKEHHHSLHSLEECLFREYFSFDIKTFELKKVCGMNHYFPDVQPYFGFPLSLSKPCI